ncbi:MAG: hypothetical protein ACRDQA_10215 [Nocardioidaceae bacterium]
MTDADTGLRHQATSWSPKTRLVTAVVLACALLVAVVAGVVLSTRYIGSAESTDGHQLSASMTQQMRTRADVRLAVSSFAANLNTYSVKNIDGYRDRLAPMMTKGFAKSFKLALKNIVSNVKVTKMTSKGKVLKTAVSTVDANHATALVVADAHVTSALGKRMRHFRWKVTVVKTDGSWLIDNFKPVE